MFGVVDSYNEVVAPGAFLESIEDARAKARTFSALAAPHRRAYRQLGHRQHEGRRPRLFGAGELWLQDAPYARIAYRGMQTRSITGLSIGYYVRESSFDEKTRIRTLTKLDLIEISIVTVPANDEARTDTIKSKLAHGGLPSMPEFELLLREAGFSKTQSAVIANRGLQHLLRSESEGDLAAIEIVEALKSRPALSLPSF